MFIIAGLLVGFGSQLGNGCTSGHGICGISSFRIRSLVATCTFLTTGVITAVVANTSSYQPYFENILPYDAAFGCLGVALALLVVLLGVGRYLKASGGMDAAKGPEPGEIQSFRALAEVITGITFATGLAVNTPRILSRILSRTLALTLTPTSPYCSGLKHDENFGHHFLPRRPLLESRLDVRHGWSHYGHGNVLLLRIQGRTSMAWSVLCLVKAVGDR